jgi:cytochrome c oxidase assembly factor CtaG
VYASFEALILVPLLAVGYALWTRPTRTQAAAAAAALLLLFAFFVSPVQEWATHTFLWAHLLQNVVLAEWAPALLVLAIPPGQARRIRVPMLPALVAWLVTYFVWHLPWLYDVALHHQHSLLHVEHMTYLIAGIALWWPVIHGDASPGTKAVYLAAAFYEHAPRTWGPSPLADQQIAGVTMALEQAAWLFAGFAYFLHRFLQEESREPELFRSNRAA